MIAPRIHLLLLASLVMFVSCRKEDSESKPKIRFGPTVTEKEDGLTYAANESTPFTGTTRRATKETRALNYECEYVNGKKEGWERRWFAEKPEQMSHQVLWVRGEPTFYWRWWPNGNLRELVSQTEGSKFGRKDMALGSYVKWFEDGRIKFMARYDEDFKWHGRALDYNDAGELMWDAKFDRGQFVSGVHPPDYTGPHANNKGTTPTPDKAPSPAPAPAPEAAPQN